MMHDGECDTPPLNEGVIYTAVAFAVRTYVSGQAFSQLSDQASSQVFDQASSQVRDEASSHVYDQAPSQAFLRVMQPCMWEHGERYVRPYALCLSIRGRTLYVFCLSTT